MKNNKCVEMFLRIIKIIDRLPKHTIKEKKQNKISLLQEKILEQSRKFETVAITFKFLIYAEVSLKSVGKCESFVGKLVNNLTKS